ncbi:MAG: entry exclusion 1 domain-containing protein [Micavibrio aeruginosavorus]|uniref:Entry exclusion 1 domain-containing protein n=1 Tax=Micavibrio aeruginosavorus TaxID=349221 RepID=A0A2W5BK03_9BACT|nr:MAG: entry exclusion 1 domain-containing protein [Micavibrio aeruginosavorus]
MAKVGAQRAAELTGRSKSTVQRAMNSGKLSFEIDGNGRRLIDASELDRVFGLLPQGADTGSSSSEGNSQSELQRAADMLEIERLKMRVRALEEQLDLVREQYEDMRGQRDLWQKQSQQILITSQYSQKQAEELKEELRQREERARQAKQKMLEDRMKRMQGQNENSPAPSVGTAQQQEQAAGFDFHALWSKIRGGKAA